jgi:hypothetical protein
MDQPSLFDRPVEPSKGDALELHGARYGGLCAFGETGIGWPGPDHCWLCHEFAMSAPVAETLPPFEGRTVQAKHASYTGAVHAHETRQSQIDRLRRVWVQPLTLNEAAEATGIPLASVCRRKAEMEQGLEFVEFQTVQWAGRSTKRTRWKLRTS